MTEQKTEDFLTCAVCFDVFKDPRNLACGHTFCRSCLGQFTLESEDAALTGSVPCPYCRQLTKVPDSSVSRHRWVGQMRSSVLLTELADMDAIVRRDTVTEKDDNDTLEMAERKRRYHDHPLMMSYCLDCQTLDDNECSDSNHPSCEMVTARDALPSVVEHLKSTREKLTLAAKATIAEAEKLKSRRQKVEKSKEKACEEIRSMCDLAVEAVRRREVVLLSEADQKADEEKKKIQLGIRLTERSAQIQEQQAKLVDEMLKNGSDVGKLEMQVTSSKLFFENEGPGKHKQFQRFWVRHNIASLDNILLDVIEGAQVEKIASSFSRHSLCSSLRDCTFDVKTEDNEGIPFLVDVVVICHQDVYALVVTDNSNCCAKSLYKGDTFGLVESKIKFHSPPWGIDKLVSNQVLVALPDSKQIARLRVTPQLETITKIFTRKSYRSITVLNHNTIAVGVCSPDNACVDILNLSGQIQKSFSTEFPVENPSYLSFFRQDNFLISDFALGTVTCVNLEGIVQFTYKRGLIGPSGISVDEKGNIFIVDRAAGNLVEYGDYFSQSLNRPRIQNLLRETQQTPWGVFVDENGYVYITQGGSIREVTEMEIYEDLPWSVGLD